MSRRIEYIDICKALAIFAMVFCHVGLRLEHSDSELSRYIICGICLFSLYFPGLFLTPING